MIVVSFPEPYKPNVAVEVKEREMPVTENPRKVRIMSPIERQKKFRERGGRGRLQSYLELVSNNAVVLVVWHVLFSAGILCVCTKFRTRTGRELIVLPPLQLSSHFYVSGCSSLVAIGRIMFFLFAGS